LIRIKEVAGEVGILPLFNMRESAMSVYEVGVMIGSVSAFALFLAALSWAQWQTRSKTK
jgi:hypothetical protein